LNLKPGSSEDSDDGDGESFPTPTVYDATGHGSPRAEQKDGSRHAVSLHHLAAGWPTPMAGTNRTSRKAQEERPTSGPSRGGPSFGLADVVEKRENFPTPTASDASGGPGNSGREGGDNLRTAIAKFPTPTVMDAAGFRGSMMEGRTSENHGRTLTGKVLEGEGQHWPTPRAKDWKGADPAREENRSGKRHAGDDLSTAVDKREMWPTPMSADANGVGGVASRSAGRQTMLHHAVKSYPTPMAGPTDPRDGGGAGGVALATVATDNPDAPRGQLNPDWVEWLMGWPVGWTSTEPLSPEALVAWDEGMSQRTWWHSEPPGIPRIAVGVPSRVSRLKAIGNGQVSLCAATAAPALLEMLTQIDAVYENKPEITLADLLGE